MGAAAPSADGTLEARGVVHGGQNGIAGASIYLYTAGTGGLGSAATSMLTTPVTTDRFGSFGLTGDYHCVNASDQTYLAAVGGDPGVGVSNPAAVLVVALGDCGNLNANTYITVNEVTTAAVAWALGHFSKDYADIGATSSNSVGFRNAFLDAKLIADSSLGTAATLPSNLTIEAGKLYALADALAPCVNSTGSTGGPCGSLYAAAPGSGSAPTDVFHAALNIVANPGSHVADVWNCITAAAPFPTTLTAAPNDWTMSLTATGGGLALPTQLGLDAQGNVWVADYSGLLSAFTPQATPFTSGGYGSGKLAEVYGLAVDPSGNVWLTNEESPVHSPTKGSVVKFQGVGGTAGTYVGTYSDTSIDYPEALFADSNGNIDIANNANGSATIYNNSGTLLAGGLGSGAEPESILADAQHGVWMANGSGTVATHIVLTDPNNPGSGSTATNVTCCSAADGVAQDKAGNVWLANYSSNSVSEISSTGVLTINQTAVVSGGNSSGPGAVAIDGAQNVWVLNYRGNTISEVAGNYSSTAAGTMLTPAAGLGLDASLSEPFSLQPDASGNLWVANYAGNDLVMFFGLTAPTVTPLQPLATAP